LLFAEEPAQQKSPTLHRAIIQSDQNNFPENNSPLRAARVYHKIMKTVGLWLCIFVGNLSLASGVYRTTFDSTPKIRIDIEEENVMKHKKSLLAPVFLLAIWLLSACGGAPAATESAYYPEEAPMPASDVMAQDASANAANGGAVYNLGAPENSVSPDGQTVPDIDARSDQPRMIIKNAELRLMVAGTDVAIDGVTQIVGDVNGYIISSRVWYQDWEKESYKYSTITFGVPVSEFETALRRLRNLSVKVVDENASGQDVSDQFVDLDSQVRNLEATRDRLKTFLEETKNVDEALRVNQELANIEAQIEQLKGQMNYLSDRAAYSTITVNLDPELPAIEPLPTPTPKAWSPSETFGDAQKTLVSAYQGIFEILIWLVVVVLPIVLPPFLILWLVAKFFFRKK
jgi:hypothetical protein